MRKLEYSIRGFMWMLWMIMYVALAAWVGEGLWDQNSTRFLAIFFAFLWVWAGLLPIELLEAPQNISKALLEEDN